MPEHDLTLDDPLADALRAFEAERDAGKAPELDEFCQRYPDLGSELRDMLAAAALLDRAKLSGGARTGDFVPSRNNDLPTALGEYRILRKIGAGGMGVVYEAVQESLNRHVALKVLPPNISGRGNLLERFRREAQAAAKLHHTNIVPVFGIDSTGGTHYYAMQYIRGRPLDEVVLNIARLRGRAPADAATVAADTTDLSGGLSETGRGYWANVARVGQQVASALDYAHAHGIVHRDIKPSNLLLDGSGTVWVTDFGLAKSDDTGDSLSETGDVLGTLRYMAPERFRGETRPESDLYALGLTLYELLTFRPAFDAKNRIELIAVVQRANPERPRKLNPDVPKELETIVLKAIEPDPAHRYRTGQEFADDLLRFVEDRPILAKRAGPVERLAKWAKRNPMAVALILVLVGGVIASSIAGVIAVRRGEEVIVVERQKAIDTHRTALQNAYERGGWKTVVGEAEQLRAAGYELNVVELLNVIRARDELRQTEPLQAELNRLAAMPDLGDHAGRAALYRGTMTSGLDETDGAQQLQKALTLPLAAADREYALGMLATNMGAARIHFERALAADGLYQPARLQLYLIATLQGDAATMRQVTEATRLLFPDLPDSSEFALAYYAFTDQPKLAEQAIDELAQHVDLKDIALLKALTQSIPTLRDELEIASGSLDGTNRVQLSKTKDVVDLMAQLGKRRGYATSLNDLGLSSLWFARRVRSPAWAGRLEQLMKFWEGLYQGKPGWLQTTAQAALANPKVLADVEALERDVPMGMFMITRALLVGHMASWHSVKHGTDDRFFALLHQAAQLFLKAASAPGFIHTALIGRDGFVEIEGMIAKKRPERADRKRLAEAMAVLAERIAASPLTKSRREQFFAIIEVTTDWQMARQIVDQWKRIDPMNRDAPNWDILLDMHQKNHVRALDRINLQLATWEVEEWGLGLNPLGALGQVVSAHGNAAERLWLNESRENCKKNIAYQNRMANPMPVKGK